MGSQSPNRETSRKIFFQVCKIGKLPDIGLIKIHDTTVVIEVALVHALWLAQ